MKYGIVDIGSNTVRLNLYLANDKDEIISLLNKKTVAGLSTYIKDGQMTKKGADKLIRILKNYKQTCDSFEIDEVHLFATAALRNATNSKDVISYVEESIGKNIDLISGDEEANLGYIGISEDYDIKNGYIVDIGGGSIEISLVEDGKISYATSLTEGHLSMYKKYSSEIIPSKKEVSKMKKRVRKLLEKAEVPVLDSNTNVYGVGGTIRACGNISQELFDLPTNSSVHKKTINKLKNKLINRNRDAINKTIQIVPERIHTITPGLVILSEIFDYVNANELNISKKGVREGYLVKNM